MVVAVLVAMESDVLTHGLPLFQSLLIQLAVSILLAVIMYYGIIQQKSSANRILVGWGIVLPFTAVFPFWLVELLEVRHVAVRMGMITVPMISTLRCLQGTIFHRVYVCVCVLTLLVGKWVSFLLTNSSATVSPRWQHSVVSPLHTAPFHSVTLSITMVVSWLQNWTTGTITRCQQHYQVSPRS